MKPYVRRIWTERDLELLRRLYADSPTKDVARQLGRTISQVYRKAYVLDLKKSAGYLDSPDAGRLQSADVRGWNTRFRKGQVPFNKGLRRPGWGPGRMKETQFKKGERRGVAVKLWKPIGTERLSKDGYVERKINNGSPPQRRWRAVHLLVWEAANGPLPKRHAIRFKDGNKLNISLENLELISRSDLMRRNTVHNLPKPLAEVIQLKGALKRKLRRLSGEEQNQRPAQSSL